MGRTVVSGLLLFLSSLLLGIPAAAAVGTTCTSCADCTAKLDGTYAEVTLAQDILDHAGDCITIGGANVTLDCADHEIRGSFGGRAIVNEGHDGVTIERCRISRFSWGILLVDVSSNIVANNLLDENQRAIALEGAASTQLQGNTVHHSAADGIYLWQSTDTVLTQNESCASVERDIHVIGGSNNTGTQNRCDVVEGWDDSPGPGCTLSCTICDDADVDGVCDADDNCVYDENTDQQDSDTDGVGDVCDNCPFVANADQANSDLFDDQGDACDTCWAHVDSDQFDDDGDCAGRKQDPAYWDGSRWLLNPWCGDPCDNCPFTANADQLDSDGDGFGDVCDNCPEHANADQSDLDDDQLGDICDNCWIEANAGQQDQDGDCIWVLPYVTNPRCGDACDNCPEQSNWPQDDRDGDGEGDSCDCDDSLMGENELGSDCGGVCAAACPSGCVPILVHGDSNGKLDIVIIPSSDFSGVGGMDEFRTTATDEAIFGGFLADSLLAANEERINFWYAPEIAPLVKPGSGLPCSWTEPPGWRTSCPEGSVGVILHKGGCRDHSKVDVFSGNAYCKRTFPHELGHVFGLQEDYDDCSTSYQECVGPFCNIYKTMIDCQSESLDPAGCTQFTACADGWFSSQPQYSIMAQECGIGLPCGLCDWGPDAERVVVVELNKYVDPPWEETRKAIVGYFHDDGTSISLDELAIVYGDVPERFIDWGVVEFRFIDSCGQVVNRYSMPEPRYEEYINPGGGALLDEVDFASVFPFLDRIKTLEVYDHAAGGAPVTFDLSEAIVTFCAEHPADPQCASYDADGDGIGDACDGVVFSTASTHWVRGTGNVFKQALYRIDPSGVSIEPLASFLPLTSNLDAVDRIDGAVLFSVTPNTALEVGGTVMHLRENVVYRYDAGTVEIELDPVAAGVNLRTLDAIDALGDGSFAISVGESESLVHEQGVLRLRPWQVWRLTPRQDRVAQLQLLADFGPLGIDDVDGVDVLPDGRIAITSARRVFAATPAGLRSLWPQNVYIWDGSSLIASFDGVARGLRNLDGITLVEREAPPSLGVP